MNSRLMSVYAQIESAKARIEAMRTANIVVTINRRPGALLALPHSPDDFEREAAYLGSLANDALNSGD